MVLVSGAVVGCLVEFIYRLYRYRKIIIPRFINIWMYIFIAIVLYILWLQQASWWLVIISLLVMTTLIEYLTGYLYLKYKNIRLWNYSECKFNYQGLICFRFSMYWLIIGLLYYFLLPFILNINKLFVF